MKEFKSLREIIEQATEKHKKLSEIILENQAVILKTTPEELLARMAENLEVMRRSISGGFEDTRSASGLTGGLSTRLSEYDFKLLPGVSKKAVTYAVAVAEHNACMGRIAAAPTAGASGIIPAALTAVGEELSIADEELVMGLVTASGVGMIIAKNATVSGAEGGCQAECGSAAAMAAAALCELLGGSPKDCGEAVAFTFQFIMGLVCDPVAGLVEVPCVKRNASGVLNAFLAAEMALSGAKSVIPPDEVIAAMYSVGKMMSEALRETALGGLAATPTAKEIEKNLRENNSVKQREEQ